MYKFITFILLSLLLAGCTKNVRARTYGGSMTVNLPAHTKLVNATWKEGNLWYLTRPMEETERPVTSTFQEESSLGMLNGRVTFVESK